MTDPDPSGGGPLSSSQRATAGVGGTVPPEVTERLQGLLDVLNDESPPDYHPAVYLAVYRHPCDRAYQSHQSSARSVSAAISLREVYVVDSEDDRFAGIHKEGTCRKCKRVARSAQVWSVEVAVRPPLKAREV